MRPAGAVLALALLAAVPARASAPAATAWFEYLHVEANEGNSSGGHAALRFGEQVFHFQHHPGGFLRLQRVDADVFLHTYARLQNRSVHVQRIAVSRDTWERLRRGFGARLIDEESRFATLEALEAERDLLAALDAGVPPQVAVRGAAFFAEPSSAPEPALAAVASRADALLGEGVVARRAAAANAGLAALRPGGEATLVATGGQDDAPPGGTAAAPLAQRTAELLEADLALQVLRRAPPLRASAVRDEDLAELALTADERVALAAHAATLAERAVALVASRRPDFGSVLLLTLARLAAVARSLDADRLVVLDAYPPDAPRLTTDEVAAQADHLPQLLAESRAELAAARRALVRTTTFDEADLTALEASVNRHLELRGATSAGRELRLARGPLLPSGTATLPAPPALGGPAGDLHALAADAARRVAALRDELRDRLGYDLLTRNCVSEIFVEIAAALGDDVGGPADVLDCAASRRELGGCVDPAAWLRFIPFVAAAAVADEYRVADGHAVPSYRTARLAEMYANENDLVVFLREANVVTSSLYQSRDEDSAFLFFTDDAPLARPLLGALNLAVGVGASAAGLLTLPADGGGLLMRGLRGTLFSVPELGFVNIRKGSFAYAPRTPPEGRAAASAPSSEARLSG